MEHYRPVALVPIMSKIFEKIMLKKFQDFTISHHTVKNEQLGFRHNSSTSLNWSKMLLSPLIMEFQVLPIF